jgi:hypothetical protein
VERELESLYDKWESLAEGVAGSQVVKEKL